MGSSRVSWFRISVAAVGAIVIALSGLAGDARAQSLGNNAAYFYQNSSNRGVCCVGSSAFIDAYVVSTTISTPDICKVLQYILVNLVTSSGAVIDARGLNPGNTSMTCTTTTPSPWSGISSPPPSTILLPATTASTPIIIPSTWILPNNTHLIGAGDNTPSAANPSTTIQASTSFQSTPGPMIQFGSSTFCSSPCTGISVERLTLDGGGSSINGIVNQYAQWQSTVDHVTLYQIRGIGLTVSYVSSSGSAVNSGPYSNITFDTGSYSGASGTTCAQIIGLTGTRGIHKMTCRSETNDALAGILLDSSNNTIEDVSIKGFYDGIRVGYNAPAISNILVNIFSQTPESGLTPINVVHITDNGTNTVSDLSVVGVSSNGGSGTYTIKDERSGATLTDPYVAIYALGEQPSGGGYSRFTTSPGVATWSVGTTAPTGSCARGSLYSCTGTSTNCSAKALWSCLPSPTYWTSVM